MQSYEELKEILCKELDKIADRGEMTASLLDTTHKLTDTIKNLDKIMALEENGYSGDGGWQATGMYRSRANNDSYRMGNSYANRSGSHYVRGHYSMADGKEYLVSQMRDMMDDGSISSQSRNALRRAMETLQNE